MLKEQIRQEASLPNILVYIDVRDHRPTAPALFALSEARRIARLAGASTFAVVATSPLGTDELETVARPIAEAGADKLLLCEAEDFAGPPDDAAHGRALDATLARVPAMLVLFPPGAAANALAPTLAARLGAPFMPCCDFVLSKADVPVPEGTGRVQLIRVLPDGRTCRRLDPVAIQKPIVATLTAGRRPPPTGNIQHLEIEVVSTEPAPPRSLPLEEDRVLNPHAAFELASVVVLLGEPGAHARFSSISLEALAATAPSGTVVARASDVPRSVLATSCPEVLVKIGASAALTARSPRTRVVMVTESDDAHPVPDDVDVLWQIPSPEDLTTADLAALLAEIGDRA